MRLKRSKACRPYPLLTLIVAMTLSALGQQRAPIPTQQQLAQLDAVLDASPDIGHLFRSNPARITEPSVITKFPSLQSLFKQNPDLLVAIVRYKNEFQQREFRFAYGSAATAAVPRVAVDWWDAYLTTTPALAAALKRSPAAIDDASIVNDQAAQNFLSRYPMFSDVFKKHPAVFLYNPDFFKPFR